MSNIEDAAAKAMGEDLLIKKNKKKLDLKQADELYTAASKRAAELKREAKAKPAPMPPLPSFLDRRAVWDRCMSNINDMVNKYMQNHTGHMLSREAENIEKAITEMVVEMCKGAGLSWTQPGLAKFREGLREMIKTSQIKLPNGITESAKVVEKGFKHGG